MNSKEKGKRGELEWAHYLTEKGFPARRGQQYKGGDGSPDVICPSLPELHFEVKRTERLRPYEATEQAERDSEPWQYAIVPHRKNNSPWHITLKADTFFDMFFQRKESDHETEGDGIRDDVRGDLPGMDVEGRGGEGGEPER